MNLKYRYDTYKVSYFGYWLLERYLFLAAIRSYHQRLTYTPAFVRESTCIAVHVHVGYRGKKYLMFFAKSQSRYMTNLTEIGSVV